MLAATEEAKAMNRDDRRFGRQFDRLSRRDLWVLALAAVAPMGDDGLYKPDWFVQTSFLDLAEDSPRPPPKASAWSCSGSSAAVLTATISTGSTSPTRQ
jgi:hypothetical protein